MFDSKQFTQYQNQGEQYLKNGYEFLEKGEYRKASELFWGAVAQTIKALAILYDIQIVGHPQIRKFINELAKQTNDLELIEQYETVEKFHVNFYDEILSEEEIAIRLETLKKILNKLGSLIGRRLKELK